MRRLTAILLGLAAGGVPATPAASEEPPALARADQRWSLRAEGQQDGMPSPEAVASAIEAAEAAWATRPEGLAARWRLLRALHFGAEFGAAEAVAQRLERGRELAEAGLDALGQATGRLDELDGSALRAAVAERDLPVGDVARLHFWSAIVWGAWSREAGLLAAVRSGVANRLHRYARASLALDPAVDDGGAQRLLGRLHAGLPRVPLLSGWVDRDAAIPLLERGLAIAPEHPGNHLLLGITLLELAPDRRAEALDHLRRAAQHTPRPERLVEEWQIRRLARERLAEEGVG